MLNNYYKVHNAFLNVLTKKNNKLYSLKILEKVLYLLWKKEKKPPLYVLFIAIQNVIPILNFKKIKYRNKSVKIPSIQLYNFYRLGISNLIKNANLKNKEKILNFEIVLANVILESYHKKSQAYFNKIELHKEVIENKLNSRFV
jgi:ribosomal protein S7